jgi:hypothetical protein
MGSDGDIVVLTDDVDIVVGRMGDADTIRSFCCAGTPTGAKSQTTPLLALSAASWEASGSKPAKVGE